ncbi:kinase-like protein [Mytilinidion resinicola]|uniref:non-specific serine/threonine protein kinase n=1 Tax=Mytilinidion resinicola TaxID=574789 RepID=A0A6A6YE27_9PEZI|nr:kinase-like protein [Mytilinidion resinicola]KAF2806849.1 kinase-like protein [Mytilinidion resinicola]
MASSQLQLPVTTGTKLKQIEQAKEMQTLVEERARRAGGEPPPYEFLELIGKGSFGRVFKSKSRKTNELVAVKILDVDNPDYIGDNTLDETLKEISVLQQLSISNAKHYVNIIMEALPVHNELWIVSEYCPGGSVYTLMKPTLMTAAPGLEEKYVIAIARELASALKFIHEASVLHRDLKCGNILISEQGRLQLCDFGVSNVLEPQIAKRSTIVGTPNWMAPELQREWVKDIDRNNPLQPQPILYGSEIDVWAYGCTIFEMVTGAPPFHRLPPEKLPEQAPPRIEGERYSEGICQLVAYVLEGRPKDRPTADQILEHPYLADTSQTHPTSMLKELIERYIRWEQGGGVRASLFNMYGAQAPDPLEPHDEDEDEDDWNFSTTDEFDRRYSRYSLSDPFGTGSAQQTITRYKLPKPDPDDRFGQLLQRHQEQAAERGKKRLDRIFDPNLTPYRNSITSERPPSDLILRDFNPGVPNRETVIDLDFAAPVVREGPPIDLGEIPTLKARGRTIRELDEEEEEQYNYYDQDQTARRATQDWNFTMAQEEITARRTTKEWKLPKPREENINRQTIEWTFPKVEPEEDPKPPEDLSLPILTAPLDHNRRTTRDFVFPAREPDAQVSSMSDQGPTLHASPTLGAGFRPQLRHVATEPIGAAFEDFQLSSAPESPLRTSMIDLDMAYIAESQRPSTANSATDADATNENPFNLEDQVKRTSTNNRASFHRPTQSEPMQQVLGLLTPSDEDPEHGYGSDQDQSSYHGSLHTRGASVSQQDMKPPPSNIRQRPHQSHHQPSAWDTWNHNAAYDSEYSTSSPPPSYNTDLSADDDESLDELWDQIEALTTGDLSQWPPRRPRRSPSQDNDIANLPSDLDDFPHASSETILDTLTQPGMASAPPRNGLRAPPGPGGRLTVNFPIPRGPDPEVLASDTDPDLMAKEIRRSTWEMYNALHVTHQAFSAVKRLGIGDGDDGGLGSSSGDGGDEDEDDGGEGGTVRLASTANR